MWIKIFKATYVQVSYLTVCIHTHTHTHTYITSYLSYSRQKERIEPGNWQEDLFSVSGHTAVSRTAGCSVADEVTDGNAVTWNSTNYPIKWHVTGGRKTKTKKEHNMGLKNQENGKLNKTKVLFLQLPKVPRGGWRWEFSLNIQAPENFSMGPETRGLSLI